MRLPPLGKLVWLGAALPCLMVRVTAQTPPLIPRPAEARYEKGWFDLGPGLRIAVPAEAPPRVAEIASILREGLAEFAGVEAVVEPKADRSSAPAVFLRLDGRAFPAEPEAYRLEIGRAVQIVAADPRGLLWGVQTLLQSIERPGAGPALRRGTLTDRPSRPWRGLMLDPVRSFLDLDFVRRTIRVMSAYKLNVLHFHLIDDEAWRFESKVWPRCNRPGEPVYPQAELRGLVAFARRYGVEIVPEFDVPGHSMTAVNAYPELDCERRPRPMNQAIFCAGRPFTWEFIDRLVAEAAEIFPSEYIHLGADEPYAIKRWAACPDCRARMTRKGITTLDALYHTFVNDLDEVVKRRGKRLIVWNDAIHPGVAPMPPWDIVIDAWIDFDVVGPLAERGYTILNSSSEPLYLTSFGWREGSPLAAVLKWNATRFAHPRAEQGGLSPDYRTLSPKAKILGGHASAWATEQTLAERRLYPRLLAVAENLWAEECPAGASEFEKRFRAGHADRLARLGVPDDEALPGETLFAAAGAIVSPGSAPAGWLGTARACRDFRLTFELRADAPGDHTGVFVRCAALPRGGAAPAGFPIVAAAPPGRVMTGGLRTGCGWDQFEIVARGPVLSLTINGGLAWSVTDPAPRAGLVVFKNMGRGHEFRNVRLWNLDGAK